MQSLDLTNREETLLDIYAGKEINGIKGKLFWRLCIEAKKNDPRYNNWCFFQFENKQESMQVISSCIQNIGLVDLIKVDQTNKCGNETFVQVNKLDYDFLNAYLSDFAIALKEKEVERDYFKSEKSVVDNTQTNYQRYICYNNRTSRS